MTVETLESVQKFNAHLINSEQLPLVIEPKNPLITFDELLELLKDKNEIFKRNLLNYGGLLFRNFPIHSAEDFSTFIKHFNTGDFVDYVGGDSPRKKITEGVYTSTEAPPYIKIPLHNELSYVKNFPSHIYFYCEIPPLEKGETIIANARTIYNKIDESVKKPLIEKKIRYISSYYHKNSVIGWINPSHKPWTSVFETSSAAVVEKKCRENEFGFSWKHNQWIQITQNGPAVLKHPKTQEMVWFNQAHLFDFSPKLLGLLKYLGVQLIYLFPHTKLHQVTYGDGTRIPRKHLSHILDVLDQNTIYFPWKKGDILVLDNILSMHGRAVFRGKRRILTAMT